MTDPAVALMNAPPRARQAIAVALLVLAVCLAAFFGWWTLLSLAGMRSAIVEKREIVGRLQAIAALKDGLLTESKTAVPSSDQGFLEGQTEAVIRGNVQTKLGSLIGAQGASLISTSNAADLDISGVRYLGVRIDMSGSVESVHNAVLAIETTTPMIVKTASIWQSGAASGGSEAPQLTAQINVYGPLSSGDVKTVAPAP